MNTKWPFSACLKIVLGLILALLFANVHALETASSCSNQVDDLASLDSAARLAVLQHADVQVATGAISAEQLISFAIDDTTENRLEAIRLLRYIWTEQRIRVLSSLGQTDSDKEEFRAAIVGSAAQVCRPVLFSLFARSDTLSAEHHAALVQALGRRASSTGEIGYQDVIMICTSASGASEIAADAFLRGVVLGAAEGGYFALLKRLHDTKGGIGNAVSKIIESQRAIAVDDVAEIKSRVTAVLVLSADSFDAAGQILSSLLSPVQPIDLQSAVIRALSLIGDERMVDEILNAWPSLSPPLRQQVMFTDIRKPRYLMRLLNLIQNGDVDIWVMKPWGITDLLQYPEIQVRTRAKEVLQPLFTDNLDQAAISPLELTRPNHASLENGKTLFEENCSICHRFNGTGNLVGPELDVKAQQGIPVILKKLLNPNDEALTFYYSYTIETMDFEQFTGLIAEEDNDSILIRGPGAEEHEVLRGDIDSMTCSESTLMPGGWLDGIGEDGMSDLITYLVVTAQRKQLAEAR